MTSDTGILSWALFEDALQSVRVNAPRSSDKEARALANDIWEEKYFKLDLYDIDDKQLTAAEAIGLWVSEDYPCNECKDYLYNEYWPKDVTIASSLVRPVISEDGTSKKTN